ncbi:hypothetical protein ASPBRDRAFT_678695 [Aspergillus brasiliensis CBS 101740]|uniref:F-box domain-containing protein n=1 Tax=Aspergillus brasiliensis (strain CBS 101740 / IMI 381727 / IBT 21946) TaxID=767769 RepID=A0A1L9UEK2_ASPBC|nr:hypothetical protein ASPBRDRAFT_678695 [Aspergillus brasiliensis CBS 101740]
MRLRLVNIPFNRSASRILFRHAIVTFSYPREDEQTLEKRRLGHQKSFFQSDLSLYVRELTVYCIVFDELPYGDRLYELFKESAHGNFPYYLQRLPSLQSLTINYPCHNANDMLDPMFQSLRDAQLPNLSVLQLKGQGYLSHTVVRPPVSMDQALKRFLSQLRHLSIEFGYPYTEYSTHYGFPVDSLHLGGGLRSVTLTGLPSVVNPPSPTQDSMHYLPHRCANMDGISLAYMTIPYEVLAEIYDHRDSLVYLRLQDISLSTGTWEEFYRELAQFPMLACILISPSCGYLGTPKGMSVSDIAALDYVRNKLQDNHGTHAWRKVTRRGMSSFSRYGVYCDIWLW